MRQKCATLSFGKPHVLLNGLVCVQNLSLRWQSIVKYCEVLWMRGICGKECYVGQADYTLDKLRTVDAAIVQMLPSDDAIA